MEKIKEIKAKLNSKSPIPLYYQIEEAIRQNIQTGEFLPEMRMLPEHEISTLLNVSRNTIRKAYQDLTHEGLLETKQGKGTFVCLPKISHKFVTVVSFTQELIARGITPTSKVLSKDTREASEEVASKLDIATGDPVTYIERLRFGNGTLLGYNLSRVPQALCSDLESQPIQNESLYSLIERIYGHVVMRAERITESVPADRFVSAQLNINKGFPVLKIQGLVFNQERRQFDYCLEYYIQ